MKTKLLIRRPIQAQGSAHLHLPKIKKIKKMALALMRRGGNLSRGQGGVPRKKKIMINGMAM
jgi:hypothetical protein